MNIPSMIRLIEKEQKNLSKLKAYIHNSSVTFKDFT